MYVVGSNVNYNLGLNHAKDITKLIHWKNQYHPNIEVIKAYCGLGYTIFTDIKGNLWAVGLNDKGQCGIGDKNAHYVEQTKQINFFIKNNIKINKICISVPSSSTFWISNKNTVYANGCNGFNKLGLNATDTNCRHTPELIPTAFGALNDIVDVQCSNIYTIILCTTNTDTVINVTNNLIRLYCKRLQIPTDITQLIVLFTKINTVYTTCIWTRSETSQTVPYWGQFKPLKHIEIKMIRSGAYHALLLDTDNNIYCFGDNMYGELGLGHYCEDMPMWNWGSIIYFNQNNIKIKDIQCGNGHNLLIDYNGNIYSWGNNEKHQCNSTMEYGVNKPTIIQSLKQYTISAIKCGYYHSYALTSDNEHFLFGSNISNECSLQNTSDEKHIFCINNTVKQLTNGKVIQDIYLGTYCTLIICK
eukprot:258834_1